MRAGYNTRQKRELLRFLKEGDLRHFSVDDVVFALEGKGEKVGRTTVYRYLEQLAAQGSVRKYQNAQGVTQYQHVGNAGACDGHFHMMCAKCGNLFHVDCVLMAKLSKHLMEDHDFALDPRETVLVGVCGTCRNGGEARTHGSDRAE